MVGWIDELRAALGAEFGPAPAVATLATVDRDSCPHARAVVCRRVADDGLLWFATDARSAKSAQVRHTGRAEVAFWLATRREQFRLAGEARIHGPTDDDPRRLALWRLLSDRSRALFFWPPPGRPRDPDHAFPVAARPEADPPDEFELLLLDPERVDHLDLKPFPHRRRRWVADGEWRAIEVNP